MVIAAVCFLVILAAIGWGIYEVYKIGSGPGWRAEGGPWPSRAWNTGPIP